MSSIFPLECLYFEAPTRFPAKRASIDKNLIKIGTYRIEIKEKKKYPRSLPNFLEKIHPKQNFFFALPLAKKYLILNTGKNKFAKQNI